MITLLRDALRLIVTKWRWLLAQLFLNALLAVCFASWLWIPDSHGIWLALSVVTAVFMVASFLSLHMGTIAAYRDPESTKPIRKAWSNLFAIVLWTALFFWIMQTVSQWQDSSMEIGGYFYSRLSEKLRAGLGQQNVLNSVTHFFDFLYFYFAPGLMIPFGVELAASGLRKTSWKSCFRTWTRLNWWLGLALAVALGIAIPMRLLDWHTAKTVFGQFTGLSLRLLFGYLFAVIAWIFTLALVSVNLRDLSSDTSPTTLPAGNAAMKPS